VKSRFPLAKYRAVGGTGVAPVEEIVAKRADAAPINRIPYVPLSRKVNECGQANQAVTTEGEMIFGSYCSFDIGAPNTSI
jgi:hypothetical protein